MKGIRTATVLIFIALLLSSCDNDSILGNWIMPNGSNTRTLDFEDYGEVKATALNGRQWGYYDYVYSDGVLTVYDDSPPATTVGTATISSDTLMLSGFESHFIEDGLYYRD